MRTRNLSIWAAAALVALALVALGGPTADSTPAPARSRTPIEHLVVIFDENASFDHYFGTYPHALNPPGEPPFTPRPGTPQVNGLTQTLLEDNPNLDNPRRLDRTQPITCDQDHHYTEEQQAYDGGLVDQFMQYTAGKECTGSPSEPERNQTTVMDYYDGNTVTALWNYAQYYTLNDNSFGTQYGPSSPGALNLISGETGGASATKPNSSLVERSLIGNAYPLYDDCSGDGASKAGGVSETPLISMAGRNIGDLLDAAGVSWGWFQGGFTPTGYSEGRAECKAGHENVAGAATGDYVSYHEPFQYYASTANPHHLPPSSLAAVGHEDQANHQYDLSYFTAALAAGELPAVSFLKAAAYEDGHPEYSDPLDEQRFLVDTINAIERSPLWPSTAIVISWDDSDGWYDHVMPPLVRPSASAQDALDGPGRCGTVPKPPPAGFQNDRCGYGPRLPLLVISPWARENYVDDTLTDQSSMIRFIEQNWQLGRVGGDSSDAQAGTLENAFDFDPCHARAAQVILDDSTGEVVSVTPGAAPGGQCASTTTTGTATYPAAMYPLPRPPHQVRPGPSTPRAPIALRRCSLTRLRGGHAVRVVCLFARSRLTGRTAVRLRIVRHRRVLCTARAMLHGLRVSMTLRSRAALRGHYTLRIAVTNRQAGVLGFARGVRLG